MTPVGENAQDGVQRHTLQTSSGGAHRTPGASEELVRRLPNDIGGLPADRIDCSDHELQPWEKRCHALADVLDYHKIVNTEEKRRGVEALGAEMIGRLSYYERWAVVFANILFQKQVLTPEELALKMDDVAARHAREAEA